MSSLTAPMETSHNPLAGGEAQHLHPDPDLLPNVFAAPYAVLEPGLAFVVEDGGRAVGYILGTADTASFVDRVGFHEIAVPDPGPVTYLGRSTQ
ncbi:hypothetical protein [Streptomyces sp. TRM75563]|uniref:hypothetical protein n=1 Tax=Streptomyces sp. TRM75563 TaxID=2817418 RepID=UPI001F61A654|nr:hypothetical protein [Streptomyces sp. TRM75563]MCI4041988.1 hypothetical protein [Streptomyces sp. TRM75563]